MIRLLCHHNDILLHHIFKTSFCGLDISSSPIYILNWYYNLADGSWTSTEILNLETLFWRHGPTLPFGAIGNLHVINDKLIMGNMEYPYVLDGNSSSSWQQTGPHEKIWSSNTVAYTCKWINWIAELIFWSKNHLKHFPF